MTFPENLPPGSGPFDLSATAGVQPHEADPYACPSCGGKTVSQPFGGGDRQCLNDACDNLFTPDHIRYGDPEELSRLYAQSIEPDDDNTAMTSEETAQAVQVAVARLEALSADHGHVKAAVMLLTGLSSDEIDAVGGVR